MRPWPGVFSALVGVSRTGDVQLVNKWVMVPISVQLNHFPMIQVNLSYYTLNTEKKTSLFRVDQFFTISLPKPTVTLGPLTICPDVPD